jgi:hypothetical protein
MCFAAKGSSTLSFVVGFPFSSLSLCSNNFIVIVQLSFLFGLLVTG